MSWFSDMEAFFVRAEPMLDKFIEAIHGAAVIAQVVAPFTGSAAPAVIAASAAAAGISAAADKALDEHMAGGANTATGVQALVNIANVVATSGIIENANTRAQIQNIAQAVKSVAIPPVPIDEAIAQGLTGG